MFFLLRGRQPPPTPFVQGEGTHIVSRCAAPNQVFVEILQQLNPDTKTDSMFVEMNIEQAVDFADQLVRSIHRARDLSLTCDQ